ncbi:hypothetical protein Poli38472_013793 [Pythium oligandrum]|uniref:Uncharacterized protein n=1 Tax=Pythium oligandrum TaxID=41045 RepID=A0A8K1C237_PYTOL|nr:hypothetical protein Poli38472_013793 [Pythium oligandrum]|eukprot:TMW55031.1 hypothetical protein Poli38472_013793 [Pythium oligandrum]
MTEVTMTTSVEAMAVDEQRHEAVETSAAADASLLASEEDEMERVLLRDERSCIFETRVERAALCRDRGSAQFKLKNVEKAVEWYERALYHVDFDEGTWHFEFMDQHRAAVNEVRLPVHLNLAMCYLGDAHQNLEKVIEHANEALVIDPENAKALYRGGKAHLLTGDLDGARTKLKKAAQKQPNDKNIREALHLLAEKTAEHRAKEKQTWGGRLLETKPDDDASDDESDNKTQPDNKKKAREDSPSSGPRPNETDDSNSSWFTQLRRSIFG